ESRRAGITRGFPDRRQRQDDFRPVGGPTTLAGFGLDFLRRWTVEQSNSVLAVVGAYLTELVENASSEGLGYFFVTKVNRLEVIPSGLSTHENVTLPGCCFPPASVGYILNEST